MPPSVNRKAKARPHTCSTVMLNHCRASCRMRLSPFSTRLEHLVSRRIRHALVAEDSATMKDSEGMGEPRKVRAAVCLLTRRQAQ